MSGIFAARVQRRWADLDAQGHVNNTQLLDYLQEARTQLLLAEPALEGLAGATRVASARVQYLRPLRFSPEPLRVDVWLADIGRDELVLDAVLWDGCAPAARARTVLRLAASWAPAASPAGLSRRRSLERFGVASAPAGFTPPASLPVAPLDGRGLAYDIAPRVSDTNVRHEIDEIRLYTYVQEARVAVMGRIDPAMARIGATAGAASGPRPLLWLIAQQDIAYLAPVPYRPEPYRMRTAAVRLGTTSITINAELTDPADPDTVLVRAATVSVAADGNGHPIPLPDHTRAVLQETMARR